MFGNQGKSSGEQSGQAADRSYSLVSRVPGTASRELTPSSPTLKREIKGWRARWKPQKVEPLEKPCGDHNIMLNTIIS